MGNITSLQNPDPQIKSLQALNKKLEYEKSEQLRLEHIQYENININNLRLNEINTYYSQLYMAKFKIFRIIAIMCLPLILIGILKQRYLLTSNIASILAIIIIIIASFFIVPSILDIYNRDNMNYDEYNFPFNSSSTSNPKIDTTGTSTGTTTGTSQDSVPECVGQECCTNIGLSYNDVNKKCIIQASQPIMEGFLSGQSSQDSGSRFNSKSADKSLIAIDMSGKYYSLS